ncbi:DUF2271 domain-containing protein [Oleiharenicola lentus]|uniref:DUF2271 domain-containing protein n=1 Tax=Oleiharenicola lentus TaxID=2508720 RepID=UPI003F669F42
MNAKSLTNIAAGLAGTAAAASAAQLTATIEIPQLNVAEYHRPYVALWLEGPDKTHTDVGVWYDVKMKNDEGETWLKDLRQWWRKSGRELDLPIDGLSGPTRPVGTHEVKIPATLLNTLVDGEYVLVVEAAREVGDRELVRVPFKWSKSGQVDTAVRGQKELGNITLRSSH